MEKSSKNVETKQRIALEILPFNIFKGPYCCREKCYFNGRIIMGKCYFYGLTVLKTTLFSSHCYAQGVKHIFPHSVSIAKIIEEHKKWKSAIEKKVFMFKVDALD